MAHGLEHAIGVGPIAHEDAGLQEPWGLQRAEPRRHGMQVLRARPRPAWVQLDADGRTLKDGRQGRELNAAAAGHVEHGANGQAVRIQQRRTLGRDLPRRGQGLRGLAMHKGEAVGSRWVAHDGQGWVRVQLGWNEDLMRHVITLRCPSARAGSRRGCPQQQRPQRRLPDGREWK